MSEIILYNDDCFNIFPQLEEKSIDLVLCDMPYGTTACKWDTVLDLERMWKELKRIVKDNTAIVLTASQPFTSVLVTSNIKHFKYEWIWAKEQGVNFQLAKYQPMKIHENVLIFSHKTHKYYPQNLIECSKTKSNKSKGGNLGHQSSEKLRDKYVQKYCNYPKSYTNI